MKKIAGILVFAFLMIAVTNVVLEAAQKVITVRNNTVNPLPLGNDISVIFRIRDRVNIINTPPGIHTAGIIELTQYDAATLFSINNSLYPADGNCYSVIFTTGESVCISVLELSNEIVVEVNPAT